MGESTTPNTVSEGEKLVGMTFNPSDNQDVTDVKELTSQLIDKINAVHANREAPTYHDNLIHGEATRQIMGASMWAVKDVTWNK